MPHSPQPPLEIAWQSLGTSLAWGDGFELILVFGSDEGAKQALWLRAHDELQAQGRAPFERPVVRQASDLTDQLLRLAVNPVGTQLLPDTPLWLDLDAYPGDATWDQARRDFLYRLNERRAALAREHRCVVVLALPPDWTKPVAEAAPDLWTIRQPSIYLPS